MAGETGWAGYVLLRLPGEVLFTEWAKTRYPLRARHVQALVRASRGGRMYESGFGVRMRGTGPYAELLERRFEVACRRLGLAHRPAPLDVTRFRRPTGKGGQMPLFFREGPPQK